MPLTILPVQTDADKRAFYQFAWRVYKNDPNWVPHLWPQRKAYLDGTAAFFSFGEGEFWLAKRGNDIVGTVGTAIDYARNRNMGWNAAIFGFFEALPDDYEVARAMWDHACEWARAKGMIALMGQSSFASNDDHGFLIEGHDYPPAILMGHTPPYYADYADRYGFEKRQDSLAYRFDFAQIDFDVANFPALAHRVAERTIRRYGPNVVRKARLAEWDEEVERLRSIYNRSLAVLPEFSPMEREEFQEQADGLRDIIDPDLVYLAEIDGKAVSFALGLPNVMEALKYANGLQRPWDYVRFLLARRHITGISFKILATDPDYWGYGLEMAMALEMIREAIRKGYTWADGSLTGEDNPQTNKIVNRFGARVYRRYREYWLDL
jgi:GNAT superfamily N-acetyltransferase